MKLDFYVECKSSQIFKKKKERKGKNAEKEQENPILCGREMEWMDFFGESS